MGVTGSWVRRSQQPVLATLNPPIDDQHSQPDPNPDGSGNPESWVSTVAAPDLPLFLYPETDYPPPVFAPGGPVDNTPQDHEFGPGVGAGLTREQASEVRGYWQSIDMGTVEAESWAPGPDVVNQYHLDEIDDMIGNGASPETLVFKEYGVGTANDPDARRAHRQKRYSDRYIERHMWDAHPAPVIPRYSRGVPARQPVADGYQGTSPFPNPEAQYIGSSDRFVQAQIRRAPERPGDAWATDGTAGNIAGTGNQYGLTVWGA